MENMTECARSAVMLTGKYPNTVCWYLTKSWTRMYPITQNIYDIYIQGIIEAVKEAEMGHDI